MGGGEPGTFRGFDVLVIDPVHIISDSMVNFEMCEIGKIIAMFKNNASLDYASIVDTSTRFILVLMFESPEARAEIMKIQEASKCANKVKQDYEKQAEKDKKDKDKEKDKDEQWEEFGGENSGDSSNWDTDDNPNWQFNADVDVPTF